MGGAESREGAGDNLSGDDTSDNLRGFALMISKLLFSLAQLWSNKCHFWMVRVDCALAQTLYVAFILNIYFLLPVLVEWETFWECSINKGDTTQTGVLECATFLVYCFIFYLTVSIVFRRDKVGSNELCGRHKIISHNFPGSTGAGSGPDQGLGQNIDAIITMVSKMNEAVKQLEQHHYFRFNRQGKIQTSLKCY